MNRRVIRELGKREASKLTNDRGRRFSQTLRITTSLDLFSRLGSLNRTIRFWMSVHPLLRANIVDIEGKKCFVYDSRFDQDRQWIEDESDLDNVKYLVLDSSNAVEERKLYDDLSWLLCERELHIEPDLANQLLWSLLILETSDSGSPSKEREYAITLVVNHAISEARNAHMVLLQLLDYIEKRCSQNQIDLSHRLVLKELDVPPSVDHLYFDSFDGFKNKRLEQIPFVITPSYVEPAGVHQQTDKPYKWADVLSDAWIYNLDSSGKTKFIELQELIHQSKTIFVKSIRATLSTTETTLFLTRCKQENCTVNMALVNLVAYALRKLSESISRKTHRGNQTSALVPVTLRQFESNLDGFEPSSEFVDQLTMGYFVSLVVIPLPRLMSLESDMLDEQQEFWKSCRLETERLHRQILKDKEMFLPYRRPPKKENEQDTSFVVSNVGIVPDKLPEKYAVSSQTEFSITQSYTENSIHNREFYTFGPMVVFVSTCGGRMSLSFEYNSHVLSRDNADKSVTFFFEFLRNFVMKKKKGKPQLPENERI